MLFDLPILFIDEPTIASIFNLVSSNHADTRKKKKRNKSLTYTLYTLETLPFIAEENMLSFFFCYVTYSFPCTTGGFNKKKNLQKKIILLNLIQLKNLKLYFFYFIVIQYNQFNNDTMNNGF